jgi:predicted AAA+ superfamily ATPase
LFKAPNEVGKLAPVKGLLDAAGLKTISAANVACLVGTALNVNSDRTLWGEMAFQLGSERLYGLVAKDDQRKTAPGTKLLGELLAQAGPSVILIDETLEYLVKAGAVQVADTSLRANTLAFLQELGIAVANSERAVMVATLTSLTAEHLDEGKERTLQSLEKVLGRVEKVRLPVEGAEVYEVIRRRLFEDLGNTAQHRATAEVFFAMYQKLTGHPRWCNLLVGLTPGSRSIRCSR